MIEKLEKNNLKCNVFSVYDYDGLTMQELLCQFFNKINECVDVSNEGLSILEWLYNTGLKVEVTKKLEEYITNGTIANIINKEIFNELNNLIQAIKIRIESDNVNVIDFGAIGDGINDDTLAIQQAINTGKKVTFKKGIYKITSTIRINPNQIINGNYAKILPIGCFAFHIVGEEVAHSENTFNNLLCDCTNGGFLHIEKNSYFLYLNSVNIIPVGDNQTAIKAQNCFNLIARNSRIYGNDKYINNTGVLIKSTSNIGEFPNMTNLMLDSLLIQTCAKCVDIDLDVACDSFTLLNCGFSLKGGKGITIRGHLPNLNIIGQRCESSQNYYEEECFLYTETSSYINCNIDGLYCWDVSNIFKINGSGVLHLNGCQEYRGLELATKGIIFNKVACDLYIKTPIKYFSTAYKINTNDSITGNIYNLANTLQKWGGFYNGTSNTTLAITDCLTKNVDWQSNGNLTNITGGFNGQIINIKSSLNKTIVHGNNIVLTTNTGTSKQLSNNSYVTLIYDNGKWQEISNI